jgi:hypothetical protein
MSRHKAESIHALIERSSLGSRDACRARSRVSADVGRAIARSAITGEYVSRSTTTGRYVSRSSTSRSRTQG